MNAQVQKLYEIAQKDERLILGLMSGTSLDGLDIALCRIRGHGPDTQLSLERFETFPYTSDVQHQIRDVFAKKQINQAILSGLHARIANLHAEMVNQALVRWNMFASQVDLIASHGQTVYHEPNSAVFVNQELAGVGSPETSAKFHHTFQIGDGDHIAVGTGIITVSDFRQKHIAAGGEGAPLVVYGDVMLFTSDTQSRIMLNIGGIANFTFLPMRGATQSAYATDVGPGNTLMNQYMQTYLGKEMDEDGLLAGQGSVDEKLLQNLLDHDFFCQQVPKTTGPETFHLKLVEAALKKTERQEINHADVMATLCAYTVEAIAIGIYGAIQAAESPVVYVSGGGLHNVTLMRGLRNRLAPLTMIGFEEIGFDPDAKEAALFAVLANETVAGSSQHTELIAGAPKVCMGKISFPY